jgi:hypothetical protein
MALTIGSHLGTYEITALLGKGGMGEVYRARDSKLKRDVAIKILPEEFSSDPERVGRFQREAEALALLNHPNIGAIYDIQEENGSRFLVLELVEGETLGDRLSRSGAVLVSQPDLSALPANLNPKIADVLRRCLEKNLENNRETKSARFGASSNSAL